MAGFLSLGSVTLGLIFLGYEFHRFVKDLPTEHSKDQLHRRFFLNGWIPALVILTLATTYIRYRFFSPAPLRIDDWHFLANALTWTQGIGSRGAGASTILWLFNVKTFSGLFTFQLIVNALYVLPVYFLAHNWFGSPLAGVLAAICVISNPYLAVYSRSGDYHALGNLAFLASVAGAFGIKSLARNAVISISFAVLATLIQMEVFFLLVLILPAVWFYKFGKLNIPGLVAFVVLLLPRLTAFFTPDPGDKDAISDLPNTIVGSLGENFQTSIGQLVDWFTSQVPQAFMILFTDAALLPIVTVLAIVGLIGLWSEGKRFQATVATLLVPAIVFVYYGTHAYEVTGPSQQEVLPLLFLAILGGGGIGWIVSLLDSLGKIVVLLLFLVLMSLGIWAGMDNHEHIAQGTTPCEYHAINHWLENLPEGSQVCAFNGQYLNMLDPVSKGLTLCDSITTSLSAAAGDHKTRVWIILGHPLQMEKGARSEEDVDTEIATIESIAGQHGLTVVKATPSPCHFNKKPLTWLLKISP